MRETTSTLDTTSSNAPEGGSCTYLTPPFSPVYFHHSNVYRVPDLHQVSRRRGGRSVGHVRNMQQTLLIAKQLHQTAVLVHGRNGAYEDIALWTSKAGVCAPVIDSGSYRGYKHLYPPSRYPPSSCSRSSSQYPQNSRYKHSILSTVPARSSRALDTLAESKAVTDGKSNLGREEARRRSPLY